MSYIHIHIHTQLTHIHTHTYIIVYIDIFRCIIFSTWDFVGFQVSERIADPRISPSETSPQIQVQVHRDRVLSEGRREVGIWSSYGVQVWT